MKYTRKLLSIVLAFAMVLSTNIFAFAQEPVDHTADIHVLSESDIGQIALEFMRKSQCQESIKIDSIQPYADLEGNVTAYCVSFNNGTEAAGYVLLSLIAYGNPIVEFAFEGHGPNTYVKDTTLSTKLESDKLENYIYLGPDCFYYRGQDNNLVSLFSGQKVDNNTIGKIYNEYENFVNNKLVEYNVATEKQIKASNGSIYDGFFNWNDAYIDTNSTYKIDSFGAGSDYWLMNQFKKKAGICAPTAATNIVWYWAMKRNRPIALAPIKNTSGNFNKAQTIFNTMYKEMGTSDYFGTWDTNVPNGYVQYFGSVVEDGKWNCKYLDSSSKYLDFTNALDDNCPIHLQVRMSSSPFTSEGHDVFALGYASSTSGTQYIWVMDGWNTFGRFVKYTYFPVVKGYKIWVS